MRILDQPPPADPICINSARLRNRAVAMLPGMDSDAQSRLSIAGMLAIHYFVETSYRLHTDKLTLGVAKFTLGAKAGAATLPFAHFMLLEMQAESAKVLKFREGAGVLGLAAMRLEQTLNGGPPQSDSSLEESSLVPADELTMSRELFLMKIMDKAITAHKQVAQPLRS